MLRWQYIALHKQQTFNGREEEDTSKDALGLSFSAKMLLAKL